MPEIARLYNEVIFPRSERIKEFKEIERLIDRVKAKNGDGPNEAARKRNSIIAVENYPLPDGEIINLYDLLTEAENRMKDMDAIMDLLETKYQLMITLSSYLKLESAGGG